MSLPTCSECGQEMSRTEMAICETCERAFCLECLPYHAPCSMELFAEEKFSSPERAERGR
jgi:hypothetical protein